MPSVHSSILLSSLIILNSHDEAGGEFSRLWEWTSIVARGFRRDFTSDTTRSPLCPCQNDRIKWEPYLLLKCTVHLVIQRSMWPLPVGGVNPANHRLLSARSELKRVGSLWAKALELLFLGRIWCMCYLHVLLPCHSCWQWQPGMVFLQPLWNKEEQESQRG